MEALGLIFLLAIAVVVIVGGAQAVSEKQCPHCKGRVDKRATVCKHCANPVT